MAPTAPSTVQTTLALLPTPSPSTTLTQEQTPPPTPPNQALTPQAVVQAQDDNPAIFTTGVLPWELKTAALNLAHPPVLTPPLQPPTLPSPFAQAAGGSRRVKLPQATSPSSTTQSMVDSPIPTLACAASG